MRSKSENRNFEKLHQTFCRGANQAVGISTALVIHSLAGVRVRFQKNERKPKKHEKRVDIYLAYLV